MTIGRMRQRSGGDMRKTRVAHVDDKTPGAVCMAGWGGLPAQAEQVA